MATESKAARVSRLLDEIGFAFGRNEIPDAGMVREFRILYRALPRQAKDGLELDPKDIDDIIKDMMLEVRREKSGAGKLKRYPVQHVSCDC